MRTPIEWLINAYQTNLFVAAFNICKNAEDAKDVVRDTFIAYHTSKQQFHVVMISWTSVSLAGKRKKERAWMLRWWLLRMYPAAKK